MSLLDTKLDVAEVGVAGVDKILELFTTALALPRCQTQDITEGDWLNASCLNFHCYLLSFCVYWLMYLFKHKCYKKAIPFCKNLRNLSPLMV